MNDQELHAGALVNFLAQNLNRLRLQRGQLCRREDHCLAEISRFWANSGYAQEEGGKQKKRLCHDRSPSCVKLLARMCEDAEARRIIFVLHLASSCFPPNAGHAIRPRRHLRAIANMPGP